MGSYAFGSGNANNVIDEYKDKLMSEICETLDEKRTPLINICMNLTGDFNKASVIRANNAFIAKEVWIVGKRKFDRRGTVGTHHFEHVVFAEDLNGLPTLIDEGYTIFPVDNNPEYEPVPVFEVTLPEKTAFIYGEEMLGLSLEVIESCNGQALYIPQYGSVRSLNVAQAAAIMMYEYTRQHLRGV